MPTRFDNAHVRTATSPAPVLDCGDDLLKAIAGINERDIAEQQRLQSLDLASQLHFQQSSLDEREAELNARLAQLESRLRAIRLHDQGGNIEPRTSGRISTRSDSEVIEVLKETTRRWREAIYGSPSDALEPPVATLVEAEDSGRTLSSSPDSGHDQREAALSRMQDEVNQMHREAIEMRLATEQLWAQMSETASPTELTRSLSALRNRLAGHFQLETELVEERKQSLEHLRDEASAKVLELRNQRERLKNWVNEQYEEIERKASQLESRERELHRDRGYRRERYS